MKKLAPSFILTSLASLLMLTSCPLRLRAETLPWPRLLLNLYIDGLDDNYLRWFSEGFEEDGFNRLTKHGRVFHYIDYEIDNVDAANLTASLMCACPPSTHGIVAQTYFDRKLESLYSCVVDPNYLGNYTQQTLSPSILQVSTIGDELRKQSGQRAKVFSVGIDAEASILAGGRLANATFWIDDQTGNWCSSTYYRYMPRWVENLNDFGHMNASSQTNTWSPKFPIGRYVHMPHLKENLIFQHTLSNIVKGSVKSFKQTPMANTLVVDFALELIANEQLGKDDCPDILNLSIDASYVHRNSDPSQQALEAQDVYFRLDEDIARLLQALDRRLGAGNYLVCLAGTGHPRRPINEKEAIGSFYPKRCATLLNMYLGAIYGNERWVIGHTDRDYYLNRPLIRERSLDYYAVCRTAADFLAEFEGVHQVIIGHDFVVGEYEEKGRLRQSFFKDRSGDLCIVIDNGRNILWEDYPQFNKLQQSEVRFRCVMLYGKGVTPGHDYQTHSIFDIAPSVCQLLSIPFPSASVGKPLPCSE